ncbi:Tim44 domain-containing protein [Ramlibacter sp.]|uniref:Tim44 domain-containing protein n=1 Tax=Ramlibacter sp. TaxID=1917967 RepID=UPI002FCC5A97
MRKALALLAVALTLGISTVALDAEAKRLGGGKSGGMQRQATTTPATPPAGGANAQGTPGQTAPVAGAPAAGAAGAAAAAPKRSWMGPIAGLAAGLGLAALASHFGFGEALANMMMIGLLVMAVLFVVGMVMRKRAANQGGMAAAGAGGATVPPHPFQRGQVQDVSYRTAENAAQGGSLIGSRLGGGIGGLAAATQAGSIPADFDAVAFAGNAKNQFLALQAANDARDLDRLRDFLTPEMFDIVRAEIAERGDAPQRTEVFGLEAQVLAVVEEADRYVASVHFSGSVRDQHGAVPEDLDEIWHLTKPRTGLGGWVIAGIQQRDDGRHPA